MTLQLFTQITYGTEFLPGISLETGSAPRWVGVSDLDGDGRPDLITSNNNSSNVSVLRGFGTGNFGTQSTYPSGTFSYVGELSDVNTDGKPDLILANAGTFNFRVLLGTGSGGFGSPSDSPSLPWYPGGVAVADLNADSKLDAVITFEGTDNLSILLGNGNGTFGAPVNYPVGDQPFQPCVADFNSDGKPDIAIANASSNNVSVLLGVGNGTFGAATNFTVGTFPEGIVARDFNRDGKFDLATANYNSNNVTVLLGNGIGSFVSAGNFPAGTNPIAIASADLDNDGDPDVVTADINGNTASVLLCDGAGNLGSPQYLNTGIKPESVAISDLNGDSRPDVVVANRQSDSVSVFLQPSPAPADPHTTGTFHWTGSPLTIPNGDGTRTIHAAATIPVSGLIGSIEKVAVTIGGNSSSCSASDPNAGIAHMTVYELQIELVSPDCRRIVLWNHDGGSGQSISGARFVSGEGFPATSTATPGDCPYGGQPWSPYESLDLLNGGPPNGNWTLKVYDLGLANSSSGILRDWSIDITTTSTITSETAIEDRPANGPLQFYGYGNPGMPYFSPDGKLIVNVTDGSPAVVRDVATNQILRFIGNELSVVTRVAVSPDGQFIALENRGGVTVYNLVTGQKIRELLTGWVLKPGVDTCTVNPDNADYDGILGIQFSSDGQRLMAGSTLGRYYVWSVPDWQMLFQTSGLWDVNYVRFSRDGRRVVSSDYHGSTIKVWNTEGASISLVSTVQKPYSDFFGDTAISPDGTRVLAGMANGDVLLFDVTVANATYTYAGPNPHPSFPEEAIAFGPDGDMWSVGPDIRKLSQPGFNITCDVQDLNLYNVPGCEGRIISNAAFSPDGTRLMLQSRASIRSYSTATGAELQRHTGHIAATGAANFAGNNVVTMFSIVMGCSTDAGAFAFDAVTGQLLGRTPYAASEPWGVFVSGTSYDGTQAVVATQAVPSDPIGHPSQVQLLQLGSGPISPTQTIGSNVQTHPVCVRDTNYGWFTLHYNQNSSRLDLYQVSNNSVYASIGLSASQTVQRQCADVAPGLGVAYAPSPGKTVRIWLPNSSSFDLGTYPADISAVAVTPDAQTTVGVGTVSGRIYLQNSALYGPAQPPVELPGHFRTAKVDAIAFSRDCSLVAAAGAGYVAVWDVKSTELILVGTAFPRLAVTQIEFSPDGTKVLVGYQGATAASFEVRAARAMIVAGGGNFAGNSIARQTDDLSAYSFKTLRGRGYEGADIQYLSAFSDRDADGDGLNDIDAAATLESLRAALTSSFATASGRLLILMLDHGYKTDNFMAFRMNETQALPSTTLDTWLNDLQTSYPVDVTLVVDSCYSGKIVDDCSTPPAGRKRTVISSTTRDAEAVFVPSPDLSSFMYTFLGSAYMGNSLGEAWRAGQRFFETFPVANQMPQISDGSTTTTNADREFFGKSWAYGVQSTTDINQFFPAFQDWSSTQSVAPGSEVYLFARTLAGQDPTSVTCVVRPPAPTVVSGDPITTLPRLVMTRRSNDSSSPDYRVWETTSSAELFSATGPYTVSFSAQFPFERLSNPVFTNVTVSAGIDPDQTPIRSILAVGDSASVTISSAVQNLGPYAYSIYLGRFADNAGIHHPEWIDYYSAYPDPDRDGVAGSANILNSINNLTLDIGRLYVHLIGDSKAQGGVRMGSGDILTAVALDTALDALQSRQTCTVVLVVDAPYSGSFLSVCQATTGQQRTVMTSGRSTDQAMFLSPPLRSSFTEKLLGAGLQGNDLRTAFTSGKNFFKLFKNSIQPQLDDNGSGNYNFQDGNLAKTLYLGRRYAFAGDDGSGLPFILDATTTQSIAPGTLVTYSTTLIEGVVPSRVYLQLVPDTLSDLTPISQVAEVNLTRTSSTSWTWSATFNAPVPPANYSLIMYADYPDSSEVKPTEPQFTALIVTGTPTGLPIKDLDGDGFEDAVEFRYGSDALNPASAPLSQIPYSSNADTDGDGYKDFYEYAMGFDYLNSANHPSLGDVNGDGNITGADAIILKRIIVGTLQASSYNLADMDLNRDGQVTGADAIILQRLVVQTVVAVPTS